MFLGRLMDHLVRTPESYISYFKENNVTTIVRLNNKWYNASKFKREGFTHVDLFFIDGSTPSDDLLQKFLMVSESSNGAVAVHCKGFKAKVIVTFELEFSLIFKHIF